MAFSVLGLGDTNYDKFCFVGKAVDKRLAELGGERVVPLMCADEATNLEETVEAWKISVRKAFHDFITVKSSDPVEEGTSASTETKAEEAPADETVSPVTSNPAAAVESITESLATINIDAEKPEEVVIDYANALERAGQEVPQGLSTLKEVAQWLGMTSEDLQALSQAPPAAASGSLAAARAAREKESCGLNSIEVVGDDAAIEQLQGISTESHGTMESKGEINASQPFMASVVTARWLTDPSHSLQTWQESAEQWGDAKRVVHCELSLQGSTIDYSPGDSLGLCAPNPAYAVQLVLNRINLSPQHVSSPVSLASKVKVVQCGRSAEVITLGEFLAYRVDLCGLPKKTQVQALAKLCTDTEEAQYLAMVAGKEAPKKKLWQYFVETQSLGIAEILFLFPSCQVTLSSLVEILLPLSPRYYSIASSPMSTTTGKKTAAFAFSLVRTKCPSVCSSVDRVLCRRGLATGYLETVLARYLYPAHPSQNVADYPPVQLRVFHKSTPAFHMPSNQALPLILIGPGTGVAPFLGFLQHRAAQKSRLSPHNSHQRKTVAAATVSASPDLPELQRSPSGKKTVQQLMHSGVWRGGFELDEEDLPEERSGMQCFLQERGCGEISLFFGCRDTRDYLYQQELEKFQRDGILSSLSVAMSRLNTNVNNDGLPVVKDYVTQRLLAKGSEICELLVKKNACVYICGDGNKMAKDVTAALAQILQTFAPDVVKDEAAAAQYLQNLRARKRLCLDIWS